MVKEWRGVQVREVPRIGKLEFLRLVDALGV